MKRPLVFTNGCFDVLHRGHLELLWEASFLGESLMVAVDSDDLVRRTKGEGRPVNCLDDRMAMLRAYPFVDYVIPFGSQHELDYMLLDYCPDIYVKGEDWRGKCRHEGMARERGFRIVYIPHRFKRSTTSTIAALQGTPG